MTKKAKEKVWVPEICYEEPVGDVQSNIPFIDVPENEEMPCLLFISEYRQTGEYEPGPKGEEQPIVDMFIHQYADMTALKEKLNEKDYDKVRAALGLQPLKEATKAGQKITDRVLNNVARMKSTTPN